MIDHIEDLFAKKIVRYAILAIMIAMALISVVQGAKNAINYSQDFQWDASRALCEKIDPYELSMNPDEDIESDSLKQFYKLFSDAGVSQKMEANQFPSLLMLLFPYVVMEPLRARYAWLVSNLFFTLGIGFLLRKTFFKALGNYEFALLFLLMLAGTPYRNQLGVGQHTIFSFFFFLLAVWLDENKPDGNRSLIAVCLFISYFKYTLTAPLTLYFIYKKRYVEFAVSVVMHIIATIWSAIWLEKDIFYMIKAPLQVSSLLSAEGGIDLGALFNGSLIAYVFGALVALMLCLIAIKMPKGRESLLFALLVLWSLIITYHRTYDFFVMSAIPFFWTSMKNKRYMYIAYFGLILLVYFALRVFHENTMSKLFVGSIYYLITIAVTALCIWTIRTRVRNEE